MRYLYGDSSSFPLNQNFIETLTAATDASVALLITAERRAKVRELAEEITARAMSELTDIKALNQAVTQALTSRDELSEATGTLASKVLANAQKQFAEASAGVKAWRKNTLRKAARNCGAQAVMGPLSKLLVEHELPYTSWGMRWRASFGDEPAQATAYAVMQRGLAATLEVRIPEGHRWAQPVKVGSLEQNLVLQLMGKSWLGREQLRIEDLSRLYITRVTRTKLREGMILSTRPDEPSPGLRISIREGQNRKLRIVRVDAYEQPVGKPAVLVGVDAAMVERLWERVEETICYLIDHRTHLREATMQGESVTEVDSLEAIAGAIIATVAPLVREVRRHSLTAGELSLKRDLGDGRREELFLTEKEILRRFAILSPEHRKLFSCYGLGTCPVRDEPTEVLDMPVPKPSEPVAQRPPAALPVPVPPPSAPAAALPIPVPPPSAPALAAVALINDPLSETTPLPPYYPPPISDVAPRAVLPPPRVPPAPRAPSFDLPAPSVPPRRSSAPPPIPPALLRNRQQSRRRAS